MALDRHKHVLRALVPHTRPLRRIGLAAVVTTTAVAGGVFVSLPDDAQVAASAISVAAPEVRTSPVPVRVAPISRSAARVRLEEKPPKAVGRKFATAPVNIRREPTEDSRRVGTLKWAERIGVSGETDGAWSEVVIKREGFWVHSAFLVDTKPKPAPKPKPKPAPAAAAAPAPAPAAAESVESAPAPAPRPAPAGVSSASCPAGSSVESGLTSNAVGVYRSVCASFPSISSYGGYRSDSGAHGSGRGLDVMISGDAGWSVAEYVRANAGSLGVSEVIYSQKIWTVQRSGEGWRSMEDRGSTTANHYDHVHVTVY